MAFSVHLMSTYVQWRARMFIFVAATEPQAFFAGALIAPPREVPAASILPDKILMSLFQRGNSHQFAEIQAVTIALRHRQPEERFGTASPRSQTLFGR